MSKLLILFAATSALVQAEELAAAMRKTGYRAQVRDAETWLLFKEPAERGAHIVMVPPGDAFDDLHAAYAMADGHVTVIRDEPGPELLAAARASVLEGEADDIEPMAPMAGDELIGDGSGEALPPAPPTELVEPPPAVEPPAAEPEQAATPPEPAPVEQAAQPDTPQEEAAPAEEAPAPAPAARASRRSASK